MSGKQQNYDFDRIKYCVENLCANPDPDLVDALLDDDQLLAKSSENDPLPAIVKAFRALHEQLKVWPGKPPNLGFLRPNIVRKT